MKDPQELFRAMLTPAGATGKMFLQVRIGDLFQGVTFEPPSVLLTDELPSWQKGEPRRALDETVIDMCKKIVAHGSIFKHREGCEIQVPAMAPCPKCQGPKLEVVE